MFQMQRRAGFNFGSDAGRLKTVSVECMSSQVDRLGRWEMQRRTALADFLRTIDVSDLNMDIDPRHPC